MNSRLGTFKNSTKQISALVLLGIALLTACVSFIYMKQKNKMTYMMEVKHEELKTDVITITKTDEYMYAELPASEHDPLQGCD